MSRSRIAVPLVLCVACGAPAEPPPPPPPPPTYADFAGAWDAVSTLDGVAEPVQSHLASTPAGGGWTMSFEGREAVPMRVSLVGDSLVLISEPYESVLRPKVMVQVRIASVLVAGAITGKLIATYDTPEGQEVVMGTIAATRAGQEQE